MLVRKHAELQALLRGCLVMLPRRREHGAIPAMRRARRRPRPGGSPRRSTGRWRSSALARGIQPRAGWAIPRRHPGGRRSVLAAGARDALAFEMVLVRQPAARLPSRRQHATPALALGAAQGRRAV